MSSTGDIALGPAASIRSDGVHIEVDVTAVQIGILEKREKTPTRNDGRRFGMAAGKTDGIRSTGNRAARWRIRPALEKHPNKIIGRKARSEEVAGLVEIDRKTGPMGFQFMTASVQNAQAPGRGRGRTRKCGTSPTQDRTNAHHKTARRKRTPAG